MDKRLRILASLLAAFGLLSFVCMGWIKNQPASSLTTLASANHIQILAKQAELQSPEPPLKCMGTASSSTFLAEIRPKALTITIATPIALPVQSVLFERENQGVVAWDVLPPRSLDRPLWLMHRSLLI